MRPQCRRRCRCSRYPRCRIAAAAAASGATGAYAISYQRRRRNAARYVAVKKSSGTQLVHTASKAKRRCCRHLCRARQRNSAERAHGWHAARSSAQQLQPQRVWRLIQHDVPAATGGPARKRRYAARLSNAWRQVVWVVACAHERRRRVDSNSRGGRLYGRGGRLGGNSSCGSRSGGRLGGIRVDCGSRYGCSAGADKGLRPPKRHRREMRRTYAWTVARRGGTRGGRRRRLGGKQSVSGTVAAAHDQQRVRAHAAHLHRAKMPRQRNIQAACGTASRAPKPQHAWNRAALLIQRVPTPQHT